jgi:hypothetical protein
VRHAITTILVALHLALVVHGACNLTRSKFDGPFGPALDWYPAMSGADSNFAFFAPDVGPELRTTFILSDEAGRTWTDTFEEGANGEVRVRPSGIVVQAPWDRVLASWAAEMFCRHPPAIRVVIRIEEHVLPTMQQYQGGQRSRWRPVAEQTFSRDLQP